MVTKLDDQQVIHNFGLKIMESRLKEIQEVVSMYIQEKSPAPAAWVKINEIMERN